VERGEAVASQSERVVRVRAEESDREMKGREKEKNLPLSASAIWFRRALRLWAFLFRIGFILPAPFVFLPTPLLTQKKF